MHIWRERERYLFSIPPKECISSISNRERRRARWQAAKASGGKRGGRRAGGDQCFARRVASQRESESAREPRAGSAPGPAFYFGQFMGKDRYRNRG